MRESGPASSAAPARAPVPLSIYMDFTPRRIMTLVREGFRKEALSSQTIWLCASCYSCAVHCPQDIHITDVMYSLKREAIKDKLVSEAFPDSGAGARILRDCAAPRPQFGILAGVAHGSAVQPVHAVEHGKSGWDLIRTGRCRCARTHQADQRTAARAGAAKEVAYDRDRRNPKLCLLSGLLFESHGRAPTKRAC